MALWFILGIEAKQTKECIFISQTNYAKEILKKFGMEDCHYVDTLVESGIKLKKIEEEKYVNPTYYKSMVGSL